MNRNRKIHSFISPNLSATDAFVLLQSINAALKAEMDEHGATPRALILSKQSTLLAEYLTLLYQAKRQKEGNEVETPIAPALTHTSFPEFHLCFDMNRTEAQVEFLFSDLATGKKVAKRFYIVNQ